MISRFSTMFCAVAATVVAALPAAAQDTVKIAYVDPLSGGMASIGEVGLKTFQYLADVTNAHGGIAGHKLEIVAYDNKLNAQETLIQVQKAINSGIRYITQGNGSAVRRRYRGLRGEVQRAQPGQGSAVLQLCGGRSDLDQREMQLLAFPLGCELGHQDDRAHQLHEDTIEHQESLFDQSGLFVRPGGARRSAQDAQRQTAGHRDRRRRGASAGSKSPTSRRISPKSRPPAPTASSPAIGARISPC